MSTPDARKSILEEQRVIRNCIYQMELYAILTGIYIVVYVGTMYLYSQHRVAAQGQRRVIISITTLLFLLQMAQTGINSYEQDWIFVVNGETRQTIAQAAESIDPSPLIHLWNDILYFLSFILADCLMIWRCYHVWGRSRLVVTIPCFLLFCETAIYIAMIVLIAIAIPDVTPSQARIFDCLQVALYVIPITMSLGVTYLICHKIFFASQQLKNNKFKSIIDMLIQSSAIYTITILVTLIVSGLPVPLSSRKDPQYFADLYLTNILGPISGIIPTLMIARVTILSSSREQTQTGRSNSGLSGLKFEGQSTLQAETIQRSTNKGSMMV